VNFGGLFSRVRPRPLQSGRNRFRIRVRIIKKQMVVGWRIGQAYVNLGLIHAACCVDRPFEFGLLPLLELIVGENKEADPVGNPSGDLECAGQSDIAHSVGDRERVILKRVSGHAEVVRRGGLASLCQQKRAEDKGQEQAKIAHSGRHFIARLGGGQEALLCYGAA
jgi:hypothetical protein